MLFPVFNEYYIIYCLIELLCIMLYYFCNLIYTSAFKLLCKLYNNIFNYACAMASD